MIHYVLMVLAIIIWIVYVTDVNTQQKIQVAELNQLQSQSIVSSTVNPRKQPLVPAPTFDSNTNEDIDRVGFICCLTTMLYFAAPLSNLVFNVYDKVIIFNFYNFQMILNL